MCESMREWQGGDSACELEREERRRERGESKRKRENKERTAKYRKETSGERKKTDVPISCGLNCSSDA